MKNRPITLFIFILLAMFFSTQSYALDTHNLENNPKTISSQIHNLDPKVLKLALHAYNKAKQEGIVKKPILTIVDFTKASVQPRFHVIDLRSGRVLFDELVAHGRGSGGNYATSFSNQGSSHKSSIGAFVTAYQTYVGHHGPSLQLKGLEPGFNSQALQRAIVIHGAPYVSAQFARLYGRLGLSWGCFALNPSHERAVIDTIKGGSFMFAYYPDRHWLNNSRYL